MASQVAFLVVPGLLILLALIKDAEGGQFCSTGSWYNRQVEYCRYGCCGSFDHYCCDIGVGVIVGAVIGSIACVCVIITVICCCIKKQSYRGRVVGPHTVPAGGAGGNVTVVHSTNMATIPQPHPMGYPHPAPGMMPPQPPGYPGYGQPPPPYAAYINPAYPPGANANKMGFAAPAAPAYAPNTMGP